MNEKAKPAGQHGMLAKILLNHPQRCKKGGKTLKR